MSAASSPYTMFPPVAFVPPIDRAAPVPPPARTSVLSAGHRNWGVGSKR